MRPSSALGTWVSATRIGEQAETLKSLLPDLDRLPSALLGR
ncbi:hypothetical protein J2S34_001549 [Nitrobacter winogradskyi]|uniref:Uncharacterized protein n=1 Tax=Nitrobacter winogradskyi TaxID=913 RepID=A0ACC6AGZ1_NITWI|nr:hypothetical protein [Nitrobacter winogradskyi]